jgi:hypothetical protein
MPLGSCHALTGLLLEDGDRAPFVLRLDDGGEWRLDVAQSASRYLGLRVRVEGTRSGFNLIDVLKVERA